MMQSSIFEVGMDTMLGSPDGSNDIFHLAERLYINEGLFYSGRLRFRKGIQVKPLILQKD